MFSRRSATVLTLIKCFTPTFSETELPPQEPQPGSETASCQSCIDHRCAVRGRGVDDDTAGLHDVLEQADLLGLGGVHVQRGGVARATGEHQVLGLVDGLLEVLGVIHGQDRGELLVGELLLGGVGGVDLGDQDLGLGRNLDAGELGDLGGSMPGMR